MFTAYFDGGFKQNVMRYGYVVYDPKGKKYHEYAYSFNVRGGTTNLAEYKGLVSLLEYMTCEKIKDAEVFGDCQAIIYQVNGIYNVKAKHLQLEHERVIKLMRQFNNINISWIPREKNQEADRISR